MRASGPASVAGQKLLLTQHPREGRRALPEFGSWRDLTQPQIDSRSGPRQSPWPETVNEDPETVMDVSFRVDTFYSDLHPLT